VTGEYRCCRPSLYRFDYVIIGEPYRLCGILIQYVSCTDTVNSNSNVKDLAPQLHPIHFVCICVEYTNAILVR
jgi:hypothetical protein